MGIADRDYMRKPPPEPGEPKKPRIKRADNRPGWSARLRFWCWRLFKRR